MVTPADSDLSNRTYRLAVDDLVITGLHMKFHVEKTLKPDPNVAEITVDNLTESQREAITAKKTPLVRLSVGYKQKETQIFYGTLVHTNHSFEDENISTTMSTGDGIEEYRRKRVFASFGPKTTTATVFQTLLKTLGLKRGNADKFVTQLKSGLKAQIYLEGCALHGNAAAELTALCKSANLEWSIQDGAFQILDKNESLNKFAILLDAGGNGRPNTGLIGSPSISSKGVVTGKSLIIQDMYPGRQVEIKSRFLAGRYRLDKCTYDGDTEGGEWYCAFEGRAKFGDREIKTKFQDPSISSLVRKVVRK